MKALVLIIFLLFSSFSYASFQSSKTENWNAIANDITSKTARIIQQERGLCLIGTGGGAGIEGHLRKLNMSFVHNGELSMEEGRELVVYCVQEYLEAINGNEKIRPHLVHYPFTPRDVEIAIFIHRQDGRQAPIGFLSVVAGLYGQISYSINQPGPKTLKKVHQETYEEAVQLVKRHPVKSQEKLAFLLGHVGRG